jgi:hypothetical protein
VAVLSAAVALPAQAADPHGDAARNTAAAVVKATGTADIVRATKKDKGSAAITKARGGNVSVPTSTAGALAVETAGTTVNLRLPATTDRQAVTDSSGTVVYADAAAPTDVAVQPTTDGARVLVSIKDRSAPSSYAFPVEGPAGSRLVTAAELLGPQYDTGEVLLLDAGQRALAVIAPAWAKDATGRAVPTRYRLAGKHLDPGRRLER